MKKTTKVLVITLLAVFGMIGMAVAQVSTSYDLSWHTIASGGGTSLSSNYDVRDTLGIPVVNVSTSTNYQIESGFWSTGAGDSTDEGQSIYLPLVIR
jgi:hypothetical protein